MSAVLAVIATSADGLAGNFHGKPFILRSAGDEKFRIAETVWPLRRGLEVTFIADGSGKIVRLSTPLADGPGYRLKAGPLIFSRTAPDAADSTR